MKKIHYLVTKIDNITGGNIYDKLLYEELLKNNLNLTVISDQDLLKQSKKRNFLGFSLLYLKYFKEIFNCDIVLLNSRMYTRFIFILILRMFNKIKREKKLKIVMIHHHFNFQTNNFILKQIHKLLEISFLTKADYLILPNPYIIDITKKYKKIQGKIINIPTSFEEKKIITNSVSKKYFLYVGTIDSRKGVLYAIKAFRLFSEKYSDYKYYIVGNYNKSSNYYKKLQYYIKKHGLKESVIMTGRVSLEELNKFYENSRALLFPSLYEGYGCVIVEAMGFGIPVIAFDNSAIPYTIKSGYNGLLAKNKDYKGLEKCMEKIIDNNFYSILKKGAIETYMIQPKKDKFYMEIEQFITNILRK